MLRKYRLYTYDLWADGDGGYSVNDIFKQSDVIELDFENSTEKELITELKKAEVIAKHVHNSKIDVMWDDPVLSPIYFNYKGNPSFELRLDE